MDTSAWRRLVTRGQAVNLGLRHSMVPAFCARRPHVACMDPSLERGIPDPEALSRDSDREECHSPPFPCGEVGLNRITMSRLPGQRLQIGTVQTNMSRLMNLFDMVYPLV